MKTYIPELDGIRALAIILVLLFHYSLVPFGWIGVQIFFVLSGYLISSILLSEREKTPGKYFGRFYTRRALRIFPIYFLFTGLLGVAFLFFIQSQTFNAQWPFIYSYTLNIARILPNYQNDLRFSHLWSLAIEEQFYLFWPLVVYTLRPKSLLIVAIGIVFLAPILRLVIAWQLAMAGSAPGHVEEVTYNLTFTQLDSFAVGALLALVRRKDILKRMQLDPKTIFMIMVAVFGLAMAFILTTALVFHSYQFGFVTIFANLGFIGQYVFRPEEYLLKYSILALLAASVIFWINHVDSPAKGILRNRYLCYVGKVSYGMYLYHTVILVIFLRLWGGQARSATGLIMFVPYFLIVVAVSALSFEGLEKRILSLKARL